MRHLFSIRVFEFVFATAVVMASANEVRSETIEHAKVVSSDAASHSLDVEVEGESRSLTLSQTKFFDAKGKQLTSRMGMAALKAATLVTIKIEPDPKDKTKEHVSELRIEIDPNKDKDSVFHVPPKSKPKAAKKPTMTNKDPFEGRELKKVAKQDLTPAAEWTENIPDVAVPPSYFRWYSTAKKGDFVEYTEEEKSYVRYQVVDAAQGALIIATVSQISTLKTENRVRMSPGEDQIQAIAQSGKPNAKPPKQSGKTSPATEKITVGERELVCRVTKEGKNWTKWNCDDVPFDGLVKEDTTNSHKLLVDFGRGD